MNGEYDLWRESWISCCKELNHWESVSTHASQTKDAVLAAECAWKLPDTWHVMKEAVATLEQACPPHLAWKVHLYKGSFFKRVFDLGEMARNWHIRSY